MTRDHSAGDINIRGDVRAGGDVAIGPNASIVKSTAPKKETITGIIGTIISAVGLGISAGVPGQLMFYSSICVISIGISLIAFSIYRYLEISKQS